MVAVGVLAFGAVLGWWAVSLVGWRSPSRRAFGGVVAGLTSAGAVVVLLAGVSKLAFFCIGVAIGAAVQFSFLAAMARSYTSKGPL